MIFVGCIYLKILKFEWMRYELYYKFEGMGGGWVNIMLGVLRHTLQTTAAAGVCKYKLHSQLFTGGEKGVLNDTHVTLGK